MVETAAQKLVAVVAELEQTKVASLADTGRLRAQLAEVEAASAQVKQFAASLGAALASGTFRDAEGESPKRKPGRPRNVAETGAPPKTAKAPRPGKKGAGQFALTDFALESLKANPGSRPMHIVKQLVAATGRGHRTATAGVSVTLNRLRGQKKVRRVRGEWFFP